MKKTIATAYYQQLLEKCIQFIPSWFKYCEPFIEYQRDYTNDYANTNHNARAEFYLSEKAPYTLSINSNLDPDMADLYRCEFRQDIWSSDLKPHYWLYFGLTLNAKPFINDSIANQRINFIQIESIGNPYPLSIKDRKYISIWYGLETKENYYIEYECIDDRAYIGNPYKVQNYLMNTEQVANIFATVDKIFS